ncbi:MAG: hypothetical protein ACOYEB_07380 [Enterococcus lemanii]
MRKFTEKLTQKEGDYIWGKTPDDELLEYVGKLEDIEEKLGIGLIELFELVGAKIDYEYKLGKLFSKMIYDELNPPYIPNYSLSKINELSSKVKDTRKIDIVNKLNDKLNTLVEEYREYYNALVKEAEVKE